MENNGESALGDRNSSGLTISRNEIHVWTIVLKGPASFVNKLFSLLSSDEQKRASQLPEHLQDRFVMARGMLRALLSLYLDLANEKIAFNYTPEGKPVLAPETRGRSREGELSFNLSHCNDLALYAVALGRDVGVDVEQIKPVTELLAIAEQNFSPMEFDDLKATAADKKLETFYKYWTRKEAYAKASGRGLSAPLRSFSVSLESRSPVSFTRSDTISPEGSDWFVQELCPPPGYVASLAFKGRDASVRMRTFATAAEAFEVLNRAATARALHPESE